MRIEDKIIQLDRALATIDSLLLDSEHSADVRVFSDLYAKVNSVYIALCEERVGIVKEEK